MSLVLDQVCISIQDKDLVRDISLEVKPGEVVGLLGPNGAGKTTTFNLAIGQLTPHRGEILLDDRKVTSLSMTYRARLGIGYLPQEASVFRNLTVKENLDIALGGTNARGFVATNGGTIATTGANTLSIASTTAAAIYIDSTTVATDLNTFNFTSVISGNANLVSAGATETAITIDPTLNPAGLSTGSINIAGAFGIGTDPATATPGVTDNILNGSAAPVEVFVNGVQISP